MPELPDLEVMREVLAERVLGRPILTARAARPDILKTVSPPLDALAGESFREIGRVGKHLVLTVRDDLYVVMHLMVAGRLVLTGASTKVTKATGFLVTFADGEDLRLVENGSIKRAKVHLVAKPSDVDRVARAGVEPLSEAFTPEFLTQRFAGERRQVKKAITEPSWIGGIGTAYADEILFAAKLSPIRYVNTLKDEEIERLWAATRDVLRAGIEATRARSKGTLVSDEGRAAMQVYGRAGEPCRVCGKPIAEIRFAETHTFYCTHCQAGDKSIADRRSWLTR
ncbi:MAG: Fpg/Nei family DNA glycosylase [Candidatus Bipolaricaulota bacterium]|nr:Fpg/Nei family DNA glycosylase [Candidatus Bipolaricaulota bacterium]